MEEKRDKKRNQTVYFTSISLVREKEIPYEGGELNNAEKAYAFIKDFLAEKDRECFVTVALDSRNCPAMVEISAVGGCNICFIEPREVFKQALLGNASNIICFHNHPSGKAEASREDRILTSQLREAGRLLGIKLLDHIVIGDGCYYSFREEGILE